MAEHKPNKTKRCSGVKRPVYSRSKATRTPSKGYLASVRGKVTASVIQASLAWQSPSRAGRHD